MSGTGSGGTSLGRTQNSIFDITFEVVDPTDVLLSGSFTRDDTGFNPMGAAVTHFAQIEDATGAVVLGGEVLLPPPDDSFPDPPVLVFTENFAFAGTLGPGVYRVLVSQTYVQGSGQFDFELDIVPEPSTALLLGAGLIALGSRRRVARGVPR